MQAQDTATLARSAFSKQAAGDYAGAAAEYRELLRLDPHQVATHVNLGIVLVQLGEFDEAIRQYEEANRLLPGDPRIALNKALAYSKAGRTEEAAGQFAALHEAAPENRQVTTLLADARLQLGDYAAVATLLEPLATAGDQDLAVAYMLGLALLRTGRLEEGGRQIDRILRNGNTAEAHFLMGARLFESHDYPAAVRELADAEGKNANLPQLQSLYGRALLMTGDPEGAGRAFEAELKGRPGDYEANAGLGQILAVRGDYGRALPYLQRAEKARTKREPEVSLALAQSLAGVGRFQDALPYAEEAAAARPDDTEAHASLAAIYGGMDRTTEARREKEKAEALRRAAEPGPYVGDRAPDFSLRGMDGRSVQLSRYRGKPVLLMLGSYSCPNVRSAVEALRSAYDAYRRTMAFVFVYIREAHGNGNWQSTRNEREGVQAEDAKTAAERTSAAAECSRKLHLSFVTLTDSMDGQTEEAFHAWPSRLFVISRRGEVTYSSRLTALDFRANEFRGALEQAAR